MFQRICGTIICLISSVTATADDFSAGPLSADETAAMATIVESEVLATVSFLASDEMAGRNTPSKELDIAAAYVASRFKGARLEGLGPDGSFFQTAEFIQYAMPGSGAKVSAGGEAVPSLGILFGGSDETTVTSTVTDGADQKSLSGRIVVIDEFVLPPQAVDNPATVLATWARRIAPFAAKGAAAILVKTADDSILPEATDRLKDLPLTLPAQLLLDCPVLLIASDSKLDGEVTVTAPARKKIATPVRNVIGVLRGSDPDLSAQTIIISAHLDHIGTLSGDRPGDNINNGADDNATGVTAVVTLAHAFSALKDRPKRSVIFMTFWGEEKGLLGSKYYVDNPLWPLDKTVANINIEMIGRPEDNADGKTWGTGWTRSNLGPQLAVGAARADVTVFHREDVSEMLYTRSDNFSFVQKGVIAHSFSAGSLHGDYHKPSDDVSKLKLPHMTKIIRGLFAGVLPIARGVMTPEKTEVK